ncbi:hypothetical protein, partial [Dankookia rubra]|uniref:hypothetical protein n=1 Tax=Dankookia rubra TaxID=1442381 RepID=UPI0019D531D4
GLPSAVVTKGSAALLFHAAAARLPSRSLRDFLSDALSDDTRLLLGRRPAGPLHMRGWSLRRCCNGLRQATSATGPIPTSQMIRDRLTLLPESQSL